jgi:DNA-binding beta-propeller fold protein YncE
MQPIAGPTRTSPEKGLVMTQDQRSLLVAALLVAAAATVGCGGNSQNPASGDDGGPGGEDGGPGGPGSPGGPDGGDGGDGGTLGNGAIGTIQKVANDSTFSSPLDATPSPDGKAIYFTAIGADGSGGVFTVGAGGGPTKRLDSGNVLVSPFGITISPDGKQLYVADPAADDDAMKLYGAVFVLPASGGTPTVLGGTQGLVPRSVVVAADSVYVTAGAGATNGAGVYETSLSGGMLTTVASGAPFVDPSGVAVAKSGDVYVVDTVASGTQLASVILVHGGKASTLVPDLGVGYPAGCALVQDESALFVSGIDKSKKTDVVYRISPLGSTPQVTTFNKTISAFYEAAGLHRALDADIYAWADSSANATGTVYVLSR